MYVSCHDHWQAATKGLTARGFRLTTPDIHQYGKRQRTHAGPGWSHLVTVGYNDCGTLFFETGIAHLPNPTCVEDSGTFVEFRRSCHTDQALVATIAVTPTPYHYERKDLAWLYQENHTVPAELYKTTCRRIRDIANWDLVLHSAKQKREHYYCSRKLQILLPYQAEVTPHAEPKTRDEWDGSELPSFDRMYRQWHYAMRSHDMADAAMFGN